MSAVIEDEWLDAIEGKALFYPAAGEDTLALIEAFTPQVREFHFNDLFYCTQSDALRVAPDRFELVSADQPDPTVRNEPVQVRSDGSRACRHLTPSVLSERLSDGSIDIVIRRRRGFGQYALAEFSPGSIGVFVHRCDSVGESGSNVWFLANRPRDHEPVSNLWDKLSDKLADPAIIVSDGSLAGFKFLRKATGCADISQLPVKRTRGFEWRCIGRMTDRRGGLIWGVSRQ